MPTTAYAEKETANFIVETRSKLLTTAVEVVHKDGGLIARR